ncbi:MAG: PASTA domain-containing protein [Bacteroidetes bacterium]|nr:PASTA domain-containing protein [Bacteroidota bacterium]
MLRFFISKVFFINVIAIGIVISIGIWVTLRVLNTYTMHGQSIIVPDLKGLIVEEIGPLLENRKIQYQIVDSSFDKNLAPHAIIEQDPKALTKVKENRTIYLSINLSTIPKIPMPDVRTLSLRSAITQLEIKGLKRGELKYVLSQYENVVIDQKYNGRSIKPGTMIVKGAIIDLVLGEGESKATVLVPRLYGLTLEQARGSLHASSLNLGAVIFDKTVVDSTTAIVYKQKPASGKKSELRMGRSVDLFFTKPAPIGTKEATSEPPIKRTTKDEKIK